MKIILKILCLFILTSYSCTTQESVIDVSDKSEWMSGSKSFNKYLKDKNNMFQNVLGTWKWQQGNSYFEITFNKITKYHFGDTKLYADFIVGKYRYVENGVTIADITNNTYNPSNCLAFLTFVSQDEYIIDIKDINSNKKKVGPFILNSNITEATFTLENTHGMKIENNINFSLPTQLTLIKQ